MKAAAARIDSILNPPPFEGQLDHVSTTGGAHLCKIEEELPGDRRNDPSYKPLKGKRRATEMASDLDSDANAVVDLDSDGNEIVLSPKKKGVSLVVSHISS